MKEVPSFYNTINEKDQLSLFKAQGSRQETAILKWFTENPETERTPFEIWQMLFEEDTPITSIRRAITNLTKKGLLRKTATQKLEQYGKNNYCWKFNC